MPYHGNDAGMVTKQHFTGTIYARLILFRCPSAELNKNFFIAAPLQ